MLKTEGLFVNNSKTERYHISKENDKKWMKCKYLGFLLNTEEDIKRRKKLTQGIFRVFGTILNSKQISEEIRLRTFKQYIENIFLYNSEIWTVTKSIETTIDSFQRRLLRKVIHAKWPRTISNEKLYQRTKFQPLPSSRDDERGLVTPTATRNT